jgi:RHS repeat-associated protein
MSVPIATSPGRASFGPELNLSYDSGAGNTSFGFGWSLSLPFVTRKTDDGLPQYLDATDSDVFVLSGAEDLVPVYRQDHDGSWVAAHPGHQRDPDGAWVRDATGQLLVDEDEVDGHRVRRYRPRIEGMFARIERWTRIGAPADVHWRSISKDNVLTVYGSSGGSRIADPRDPRRIFTWLICESRDDKGNAVVYRYKAEDGTGVDMSKAQERNRGDRDDPRRSAKRYLKRIFYGNRTPLLDPAGRRPHFLDEAAIDAQIAAAGWVFEVVLDYGDHDPAAPSPRDDTATDAAGAPRHPWLRRPDPFSSYRSGFEVRTTRLCQRVLMFHHFPGTEASGVGTDCLVRSTDFTYSEEVDPTDVRNPVHTFLQSVAQTHYRRNAGGYDQRSLPPVEFTYTRAIVQDQVEEVEPASLANLPAGFDGNAYRWTDLHGEGLPGVLTEQAGAWFYKRNLSPVPVTGPGGDEDVTARFAPIETVASAPNAALGRGAEFMDLAGDGSTDVVVMDGPTPGLYEHDEAEGWQPFRPFAALPVRDLSAPNLRFVDLDGDGNADVLITEDDTLVWHASLGEAGFTAARLVAQALDEETGPRVVFADGTQSIYLADLSGDGLVDIARIRNDDVCYWPNLGHGRFGAKVTMDNAPHFDHPDCFDHHRLHLADIDGTGTTDLVYVRGDTVHLYFNQSGNAWSQPRAVTGLPHLDDAVDLVLTDLLGNSTQCLVWSSRLPADSRRPMRFVNLMGRHKPHLLVGTDNNLGAETRVTYAPSTRFYLADKRDGRPWITRLPFPVQVVERIETYDHVSRNRFTTRFAYHHGYFDAVEREFRGFGMVEQWDTEELSAIGGGALLPTDNLAPESHVPPVHVRTWFHTGVHLGRDRVARQYADEYFREPGLSVEDARAQLLEDTRLPADLDPDAEREACRALKGAMLRQEVYADDAGPGATTEQRRRARLPYTVTEQSSTVRIVQPRGGHRHVVVYTHERETINYHYERNPADPRVEHVLTLEVDDHGTVVKLATAGYGRRTTVRTVDDDGNVTVVPNPGLAGLHPADRAKQTTTLLSYTESRLTNAVESAGAYRCPALSETRTFELTGYSPTGPAGHFQPADLVEDDPANPGRVLHQFDSEVAYEAPPVVGDRCRRGVECLRVLYRRDDMTSLLPLGELQDLALPGESYKIAFTPGLLAQVLQRPRPGQVAEALLPNPAPVLGGKAGDQGGYLSTQVLKADGRFPAADANDHWWLPSGRSFFAADPAADAATELAEARQHFFVLRRYRDPFDHDDFVDFDGDDLLITATRDAVGNRVAVETHDHRVLQPRLISDANRNRTEVAFDIVGLVVGSAVMGKAPPAPVEGDSLQGFVADLTPAQLDAVFEAGDPHAAAPGLLQRATNRIVYDLDRFRRTRQAHPNNPTQWQPAGAATLARETHMSEPLGAQGSLKIQLSFVYSDGFGREIQRKLQAEPEVTNGAVGPPRWVGSGWTVFGNKGNPVREYEPFFSATHQFEFAVVVGVSPVVFYDPIERAVATLHPNHTYDKVRFDAWQQVSYDVNDTCAPRNAETGDPRTDPDVAGFVARYFASLPASPPAPPWETWHAQRIGGALGGHEQQAASKAAAHADTPTTAHVDVLGRPIRTVTRNRLECAGHDLDGTEDELYTRVDLDIEGNQLALHDADTQAGDPLGRIVVRYAYDLVGNRIRQTSMESGSHWMLNDAAGKPFRAWDGRGHDLVTRYDALRRPVEQTVRGTTADSDPRTLNHDVLVDRIEYGEGQAGAEDLNLRTQIFRHLDTAGVLTNAAPNPATGQTEAFNFKGNLLRRSLRLVEDYAALPDWSLNPALSAEAFVDSTLYDALDRAISSTAPHSDQPGAGHNVIQPVFNEANLLERVDVWLDRAAEPAGLLDPANESPSPVGITGVDYDAKGQRQRINYRNGTSTFYDYDPLTFRMVHLYTRRGAAFTGDCDNPTPPPATIAAPDTPPGTPCGVQNLHYTYDPAGNISHIHDDAQSTVFFRNRRVEPSSDYVYDALYRLCQASGREHVGQEPPTAPGAANAFHTRLDHPGDGNAMGIYLERYVYDLVGNVLAMQHRGSDPAHAGWTRAYDHLETSAVEDGTGGTVLKTSNRLTRTTLDPNGANPPVVEPYQHDLHGNVVRMPHLGAGQPGPNLQWDYKDQLRRVDVGGGGQAFYVYDGAGQRVRKVWEKAPGLTEERIYLGEFEVFRSHAGSIGPNSVSLERETLHVADDIGSVALVETRTLGNDPAPARMIRYQFTNRLGSASLELDEQAQVISYEEYAPYGSTTYQAVRSQTETPKRYRYTDKERDEESGLYWFGGRSYAPWLGRWVQCDPAEYVDGLNLYLHAANNPVRFADPTGFGPEEQRLGARMEKASKEHQDAANRRRKQKGLKSVKVKRQKGVGGKRDTIPDEVKTSPGGCKTVVDCKARHVQSKSWTKPAARKVDIEANLDQVKRQLVELQKAGEIGPNTKGAALRVIHDSDKGVSSTNALTEWRNEANEVRKKWIAAAQDPAEKALRERVFVTTTTRDRYTQATKNLKAKTPKRGGRGGGTVGKVIGVGIAAYILFDTGDAWAAAQTLNPVSNTTDALFGGNITIRGVAEGALKDAWSFTPLATIQWVVFDLMGPQGDNYWSQKLADEAEAQGRNPFCYQCHGKGGALDPDNEWNRRARFRNLPELDSPFENFDEGALWDLITAQRQ